MVAEMEFVGTQDGILIIINYGKCVDCNAIYDPRATFKLEDVH